MGAAPAYRHRIARTITLGLVVMSVGCQRSPHSVPASADAVVSAPHEVRATAPGPLPLAAASEPSDAAPPLFDVDEQDPPLAIAGKHFVVIRRYKRLRGRSGPDAQALAALDIVGDDYMLQYHDEVPYAVEDGSFSENCVVGAEPLIGSAGQGLLLETSCLPSAPLSGGPWQILALVGDRLVKVGKPLVTEGEFGAFVAGTVTRIGTITRIQADTLTVRVWTGYFFATVPLRIDWMHGTIAEAQHCFYQTGHGPGEEGCEGPVQGVERHQVSAELTFVRLFTESREPSETPEHVVVKSDSRVEFLASKVRVRWQDNGDAVHIGVDDDLWLKVRIDGREGWIHTAEDFTALGLEFSG